MGVIYTTTVGYGFQVSEKRLRKLDAERYEEDGPFEMLDKFLHDYPDLDYAWAGNAYKGYEGGFIVFLKSHSHSVDVYGVQKVAESGPSDKKARAQLVNAAQKIGERKSGVGWFVASSVG